MASSVFTCSSDSFRALLTAGSAHHSHSMGRAGAVELRPASVLRDWSVLLVWEDGFDGAADDPAAGDVLCAATSRDAGSATRAPLSPAATIQSRDRREKSMYLLLTL